MDLAFGGLELLLVLSAPVVGSFLGFVATRTVTGRPLLALRSSCDACGAGLSVADLVPIASYAVLRGRCRRCGAAIAPVQPLLEAGALVMALWTVAAVPADQPLVLAATVGLGFTLLLLAAIDAATLRLPDWLTLPLVAAGLALLAWRQDGWPVEQMIGAAAGYGGLWLVAEVYLRLRGRDGLGLGDAKLMAAAGAWVGIAGLPSVLLIGAVAGLVAVLVLRLAGRDLSFHTALPFGPFLALGFWVTWLHGPLGLAA